MSARSVLFGAAAVFGLAGLALRLSPPTMTAPPLVGVEPPRRAPPSVRTADTTSYGAVVSANIFSPTRAAPATRFSPDTSNDSTPAPRPSPPRAGLRAMRLYGVAQGGRGAIALIDADPKVRGAEVYRVGDTVRGSPIASITDSTVIVARPSGPLILRLHAAVRRRP
jgi:hypothetical protein